MRIVTKEFSYTLTTKCKNEVDLTMTRCKMITEPYTYTTLVTSVYTMRKSVAAKSQWYAATTETYVITFCGSFNIVHHAWAV